jgi:hypothetical protein
MVILDNLFRPCLMRSPSVVVSLPLVFPAFLHILHDRYWPNGTRAAIVIAILDNVFRPCLMRAVSLSCLDELVDALPEELSVIYLQRLQWMKVCMHGVHGAANPFQRPPHPVMRSVLFAGHCSNVFAGAWGSSEPRKSDAQILIGFMPQEETLMFPGTLASMSLLENVLTYFQPPWHVIIFAGHEPC